MPKIFLSYRRSDSQHPTARIRERLSEKFGAKNVFRDVDSIPKGKNFRGAVFEAISKADVVLVIIGPTWLSVKGATGSRRLDDPEDTVRIEVDIALSRDDITVIPVLVDGASMPSPSDLPAKLQTLSFKNAQRLGNDPDFQRDLEDLVEVIQETKKSMPLWRLGITGLLVALIALVIFLALSNRSQLPTLVSTSTAAPSPISTTASTSTAAPTLTAPIALVTLVSSATQFSAATTGTNQSNTQIYQATFATSDDLNALRRPPVYPQHGILYLENGMACDTIGPGDFFDVLPLPIGDVSNFYVEIEATVKTADDIGIGFAFGDFDRAQYYLYLLDHDQNGDWESGIWQFRGTNPLNKVIVFPTSSPMWSADTPFKLSLRVQEGSYTLSYSPTLSEDPIVLSEVDQGTVVAGHQLGVAIWGSKPSTRTGCIDSIRVSKLEG